MKTRGPFRMPGPVLAALLAIAVFAGPSAAEATKVLNRATSSEPPTLDPHVALGNASSVIIDDLFMGLMTTAASGETTYGLAERHTVSADGLVYTFTLRPDLRWSDGEPITSEDVLYSFRRLMNPETAARYAGNLFFIKNGLAVNTGRAPVEELGVRAPDERTVVVELEKPTPYFLKVLAANALTVVPEQAIEGHGLSWARPGNIVSNGAYLLTEWQPNTRIKLERNPAFWAADSVAIDEIRYYPTDDLGTAVKRFRAGELDIILGFPPEQYDFLRERYEAEINISPNLGLFYWIFNTEEPPFDDVRVRKALAISIDREGIAEKLLKGLVDPAWGLVPPAAEGYEPLPAPEAAMSLSERQAEARRLLAEAGYGPGKPLEIELRLDSKEEVRQIAVAMSAMWRPIGVRASLRTSDFRAITGDVRRGSFEIIRYQWYAPYDDPITFLNIVRGGARTNYSRISVPAYDAMLDEADRLSDNEARLARLAEAERAIMTEHPVIPVYYAKAKRMVAQKVQGWRNVTGGNIPSRFLDLAD